MREVLRTERGIAIEKGVPFSEDFKIPRGFDLKQCGGRLVFTAESHAAWMKELFPDIPQDKHEEKLTDALILSTTKMPVVTKEGWGYFMPTSFHDVRATLPMPEGVGVSVAYDDPVWVVRIRKFVHNSWKVVMSLTPMEIYTLRAGVKRAKGNVLICGLGLGWMTRRVLERKQVKHVTVVEKEPTILKRFGEPLKEAYGDRLTLIEGNAYEIGDPDKNPDYKFDSALWDIWDDYGSPHYDDKLYEIKKKTGHVWNWGSKKHWRES